MASFQLASFCTFHTRPVQFSLHALTTVLALFGAFLTNHSARTACSSNTMLGKPAGSVNRQDFASPYDPPFPHDLHDPQIGQFGFRASTNTPTARRPSAWAARGLAARTALSKTVQTIPTYRVYDNIAGILREFLETGLFLMA